MKTKKSVEHRVGYHVWVYGERYWHRTPTAAFRRARAAERSAPGGVQVIEVETGLRVYGSAA